MILRYLKFLMTALALGFFAGCSDSDDDSEFLFDREVTELSAVQTCASKADSGAYCFQVRFHYPIDTDELTNIYVWVDSIYVGDTAKEVSKNALSNADIVLEYHERTSLYDTVDVTDFIQDRVKDLIANHDSLMVAFYCDYSDDERPGSVQRIYLHFGDAIAPSVVNIRDSVWTTGALIEWERPSDQTDYYAPTELSGPIAGYNVAIYASNTSENINDLKVKLTTPDGVDSTGETFYVLGSEFTFKDDSLYIDTSLNAKNYLRIAIIDGKGYDTENEKNNLFRLEIDGLKANSKYTVGISSWDSSGNASGILLTNSAENWHIFNTTDSVAPLLGTRIFTIKDTLYPELARLDSNNRLRIFWDRSIDPIIKNHGIREDSLLVIPDTCFEYFCYEDTTGRYEIDYYDVSSESWVNLDYTCDSAQCYNKRYKFSADTMEVSALGTLVSDTIRWVAPGDTLILRIRAIDLSGYYSKALIDTIVVSPGALAKEVECPPGFVAVSSSDTTFFCMERYEHQNDSGEFVTNVLHSEAVAACEGISASGFTVSLCKETDWELVCLSDGILSHGVIEESVGNTSEYLYSYCNVGTNDSTSAMDISKRSSRCLNPMGVHDLPGQLQEWAVGRSEDTAAVVKGGSFRIYSGLDRETQALCTNRSFPYYTRPAYTTDTVYLYREGTKVDTVYAADTSRTLYATIPKFGSKDPLQLEFSDSLQFFSVKDSSGNVIGTDYALYSEYKKGGDEWLEELSNGLIYEPDHVEVVFLKGEGVAYREASSFYRSSSIGFRCCAYPE